MSIPEIIEDLLEMSIADLRMDKNQQRIFLTDFIGGNDNKAEERLLFTIEE